MFDNIMVPKEKEILSNFRQVNGNSLFLKNTVLPTESYQILPKQNLLSSGEGKKVTMDSTPRLSLDNLAACFTEKHRWSIY